MHDTITSENVGLLNIGAIECKWAFNIITLIPFQIDGNVAQRSHVRLLSKVGGIISTLYDESIEIIDKLLVWYLSQDGQELLVKTFKWIWLSLIHLRRIRLSLIRLRILWGLTRLLYLFRHSE